MSPHLNLTDKATSIVVSTDKGSVSENQENKEMEGNSGSEVDLIECTDTGDVEMTDVECDDATEYSSSFGDTSSGDENGWIVNDEIESSLSVPRLFGSLSDRCNGPIQMGKRRLSDHWIRFISPLMWRCKWLEVKLCELKSQELKYERELAEYDQSKQFEFEKVSSEGFDAKSRAFRSKAQRKEVMKRKKRKRVEDTTDVASYMSHHNIFSYYESKKSSIAAAFAPADDLGDLDDKTINVNDDNICKDGWPFQSRDGDSLTEQILLKMELLRSRIHILKTRMDKVVSESPQKFSSDALNNSESPRCAEKDCRNSLQCTTSQHASDCVMWDNTTNESAHSGHEEVAPVPDMIRSMSQRLLAICSENIEAEILIPNQIAKEQLRSFGSAISLQADKPHILIEKSNAEPLFFKSKQADNERTGGVQKSEQKSELGQWSWKSSG